ncbi:Acyl-CoA N-acyltransferase [Penicillium hordei]|uniref:Acyl-CoA N-acyltransferase n=1 Tax=Penicillium hordei TaxID=40994 RepID=A0AAD6H7E8_9EURO|nr:Acyl-CoA N-acyltransferase [Penicillium hordei]KAJ5617791.1 Acyl-CoA N-acyltransferase [Penicillium hordei]
MSAKPLVKVDLFRVHKEYLIPAIAQTVHLAFSSDPLIHWLRPNAAPWAEQDTGRWSWQYRRIQRIMLKGEVFNSANVKQMTEDYPGNGRNKLSTDTPISAVATLPGKQPGTSSHKDDNAGAVVFLHPPPGRKPWSLSRIWLACKLWLLDRLVPVHDSGARDKRVEMLLDRHETCSKLLEARYSRQKLWYLEVVAVHPSLQSRGLGGGVMRWILEHVHGDHIYLECTRKENVAFYESFGFRVAEEVELVDDASQTGEHVFKHWVMVHPGKLML